MTDFDWANLAAPLVAALAVVVGYLGGVRRNKAEVESLSVASTKAALESVLATVAPLKQEIIDLRVQVNELRVQNEALVSENKDLAGSVRQLRDLISEMGGWPQQDVSRWDGDDA